MPVNCISQSFGILEAIDATEYAALTADQKDLVRIILSCGVVDMSTDSKTRAYLNSVFATGTVTWTNIIKTFA